MLSKQKTDVCPVDLFSDISVGDHEGHVKGLACGCHGSFRMVRSQHYSGLRGERMLRSLQIESSTRQGPTGNLTNEQTRVGADAQPNELTDPKSICQGSKSPFLCASIKCPSIPSWPPFFPFVQHSPRLTLLHSSPLTVPPSTLSSLALLHLLTLQTPLRSFLIPVAPLSLHLSSLLSDQHTQSWPKTPLRTTNTRLCPRTLLSMPACSPVPLLESPSTLSCTLSTRSR